MTALEEYFNERPSMIIEPIMEEVPCNSSCLSRTKFSQLLENQKFREGMEVVDSLVELVRDNVSTLIREVEERMAGFNFDPSQVTYSIYQVMEYGGDFTLGQEVSFQGRSLVSGEFGTLMKALKVLESMRKDGELRLICDQIRYLREALWEHVERNMRRILVEV